jgi:hypothetical protein
MMISPLGFSDDVSKDCFSDEAKTAIWPASVPILDGWHGQLPLGKIIFIMCDVLGVTVYAQKRGKNPGADGPGYRTVIGVQRVCPKERQKFGRGWPWLPYSTVR